MKAITTAIGVVALLLFSGCHREHAEATAPAGEATPAIANESPEALGRIGADIAKHPNDARRILSHYDMDEASFEKAVRTVASDPMLSRRYRDAYRKAGG